MSTAFATATVCGSLSKVIKTIVRIRIIKFSQFYLITREFKNKLNKFYIKSVKDRK